MNTFFYLPPPDFYVLCQRLEKRKYFLQKAPPPLWHPNPFINIQHPAISYYGSISKDGQPLNIFDDHDFFISIHSRYQHEDTRIQETVEDWLSHIFRYAPFIFQETNCLPWLERMYQELQHREYWDWKEHFRYFCEQTLYSLNALGDISTALQSYSTPENDVTLIEIPLLP